MPNFDPYLSGMVSNILVGLDDENGIIYPSGRVFQMIFKSVPELNGFLGTNFSGFFDAGTISPPLSGSYYDGIFQIYTQMELTKKSMFTACRQFNLLSFQEGDSKVTNSDLCKNLTSLYKDMYEQFKESLRQTKYTLVSRSPSTVQGADGQILDNLGYSSQSFRYPSPYPYF